MSIRIDLMMEGLAPEELRALADVLENPAGMHAQIAGDAERFMKQVGPGIAAGNHRSALTLGATPTGHLEDAYQAIEGVSDATGAVLRVPRESRLRAAFGPYTLKPKKSQYLTIPVNRAAYGRRAREFEDLFPVRVGPRKTLVLARDAGRGLETMYLLTKQADIPEDAPLIPFDKLANEAQRSAEEYIDTAIENSHT